MIVSNHRHRGSSENARRERRLRDGERALWFTGDFARGDHSAVPWESAAGQEQDETWQETGKSHGKMMGKSMNIHDVPCHASSSQDPWASWFLMIFKVHFLRFAHGLITYLHVNRDSSYSSAERLATNLATNDSPRMWLQLFLHFADVSNPLLLGQEHTQRDMTLTELGWTQKTGERTAWCFQGCFQFIIYIVIYYYNITYIYIYN